MEMSDKDRFMEVMRGIPAGYIARALNTHRTGSDWSGCSKEIMVEQLFNEWHKKDLANLPTLDVLRSEAIQIREWSVEAARKEAVRKVEWEARQAEEALLKVRMSDPQKEEVRAKIKDGFKIIGIEVHLWREKDGVNIVI